MQDTIFESPFPSETTLPVPEFENYVPECPGGYDVEADALAAEQLLRSLGFLRGHLYRPYEQ